MATDSGTRANVNTGAAIVMATAAAIGAINILKADPGWWGYSMGVGGALLAVLVAGWVTLRRRSSTLSLSDQSLPCYTRRTRWVCCSLAVVAVVAVGSAVAISSWPAERVSRRPIRIAIAEFSEDPVDRFRVRNFIAESVGEAARNHGIKVVGVSRRVDPASGRDDALHIADSLGADMVVWGWSVETDTRSAVTVHVELAGQLTLIGHESSQATHEGTRELIHSFELQGRAADQATFWALQLVGIAKYASGHCDSAKSILSDAEAEALASNIPIRGEDLGNLYAFRNVSREMRHLT